MKAKRTIILFLISLAAVACTWEDQPYKGEYSEVFVYCGLGFNNLSNDLKINVQDLCEGILPGKYRDKAVLAFVHYANGTNYTVPTQPLLLQIYRDHGYTRVDTLKKYTACTNSASSEMMHEMLSDVKEMFPSRSYGMLVSSHGTGWIKPLYRTNTEDFLGVVFPFAEEKHADYPPTKSIGASFNGSSSDADMSEIDVKDFAAAIPMKMDYIIFDACLMGSAEVAYELRNVCGKIVFSPAEVLTSGFSYHNMSWNLLSGSEPDLEQVCKDYYNYYISQSGYRQSATITLVDCSRIEKVAEIYKEILSAHKGSTDMLDRDKVQKYFYDKKRWFYDLRDMVAQLGATTEELSDLDAALGDCVLYHAETPKFFDLELSRCSGMSVYIPEFYWPKLNKYYQTLAWDKATGLTDAFSLDE